MVSVGSPLDAHVDALVAQVRELSGEQRDFAKSVFFIFQNYCDLNFESYAKETAKEKR